MKILFISGLFIMGLLSSSELFLFCPDTAVQHALQEEYHFRCNSAGNRKLVLIIEDTCHITISSVAGNKILVEGQEAAMNPTGDNTAQFFCYTLEKRDSLALHEKQMDSIVIKIQPSIRE